jgi:hypothetical protein
MVAFLTELIPLKLRMNPCRYLVLFALVFAADAKNSESEVFRFLRPISLSGSIYASSNSPALFTFRRTAHSEGSAVLASREYFGPDGTLVARESVEYERDQLKRFVLEELQIQARGSATFERTADDKVLVRFEYENGTRRKRTATETQAGAVLVNDTLPDFITEHWDGLMNGESLAFRYVIIPRLETVAFNLRKTGERETSQGTVAEIEMRSTSWILQKLVDPIVFRVEQKAPHRIRQYTGRTTPKIHRGHGWDDFDALTVFDW